MTLLYCIASSTDIMIVLFPLRRFSNDLIARSLQVFVLFLPYDWLTNFAPFSQPIRRDTFSRAFWQVHGYSCFCVVNG